MAKVVVPVTLDIKQAEKELDRLEKQETSLSNKVIDLDFNYDEIMLDIEKINQDIQQKIHEQTEVKFSVGEGFEYEMMDKQIDSLYNKRALLEAKAEQTRNIQAQTNEELEKTKQKEIEIGHQIDSNTGKQENNNNRTREHNLTLGEVLKKVRRWTLAIFGVSSAYSLVRRAISSVASSNDVVSRKLEQVRAVIINAITPVVEKIVNFLMKVMVYIDYIVYALFKVHIFDFSKAVENTSKSMASTAKSAGSTAKALKQASKQLAGFDEMNVLNDNRSTGGGGTSGVGGVGGLDTSAINEFDKLKDIKIPDWLVKLTEKLQKIKEKLQEIGPVGTVALGGLAGGLLLLGGSKILGGITGTGVALGKFLPVVGKVALATGVLEGSYWLTVQAMKAWGIETDQTGDIVTDIAKKVAEWNKAQKDAKESAEGLNDINGKNITTFDKWRKQIITNTKAGKKMTDQEYAQIKTIQDRIIALKKVKKPTQEQKEELEKLTGIYGDLYREGSLNNNQMQFYKTLTDQTIKSESGRAEILENLVDQQALEYGATKDQIDANGNLLSSYYNGKIWMDKYGQNLDTITKKLGFSEEQTLDLKKALDDFENSDKSYNAMMKLNEQIEKIGKEAGLSDLEIAILKQEIATMKSKTVDVKVKAPTTKELREIAKKIAKELGTVTTGLGFTIVTGPKQKQRKGALIKYASGGIINQPGRGVPLAVGGEAGREGVIPLTDSQQMALLGEAIGKYITINANITNTMNGRVLSRELQKIQNEESFASNRW